MTKRIYLDHAATTPLDPEVLAAMTPFLTEEFGNAASPHAFGRAAAKAVEDSRTSIASTLNAQPEEILFTSSATESNNHVIFSLARAAKDSRRHIVLSAIEHHCVLEPVQELARQGFKVTCVGVDNRGHVDPARIQEALTPETMLVAVLHASNEIGTIQPVAEIGRMFRDKGIYFLVDAVQTVGHIPLDVMALGCDFLSLSAHKFYGPKGAGGLYIRRGRKLAPLLYGGDQEKGRRASTVNVPGVVGMARALEICQERLTEESATQTRLRDRMIKEVISRIPGARLNGDPSARLPNNAHFSFEKVDGEALLMSLDMAGIAVSMGSACTSGAMEPSHVLRAIGLSDEFALGSLRVTLGRWTTEQDVGYFVEQLKEKVTLLRK